MKPQILTLALLAFAFGCGSKTTVGTSTALAPSAPGVTTGALTDSNSSTASPRIYTASASVGDFLRITVDPQSQILMFSDVSNNATETVSYRMEADGRAVLTDPLGHVLAVCEHPNDMMVALVDNAGPNHDQMALVTATQAQDVTASTFAGASYNIFQFRATNGGVAIGSLAIDNDGQVTGTKYAPYKAIDGSTYPGFTRFTFQLPGGGPSPYLSIPATSENVDQYGFGSPAGLFVLDSQQGSSIGLQKGSSKLFDESWAGAYNLLYYQKTAAQTDSIGVEEGNATGGMGRVSVDSVGNLTIVDGEGNQTSGSLQPIADDLALYDEQVPNYYTGQFADPCFGMFTFHIGADASGRPVSQDVFVNFRHGAVLLAMFSTTAPISPANPYNYLYGIALAEPNSYIRSGSSGSAPAPTWSIPSNSGGGANVVVGLPAVSPYVDPRAAAYAGGAKWDGVTDDTAAINAAIDAACASGAKIQWPAGVGIINPNTTNLHLCSGLSFQGQGMGVSILRVKPGARNFQTIFGAYGGLYSNLSFQDFTLDYNTTNNQPTSLAQYRMAIGSTHGGSGMVWNRVEFRDINSINVIYSGADSTTVQNCVFALNTSGTLHHDHSTLYIAGDHAVISGNFFRGGINAPGATTAIETHGGKHTVTGNVIDGFSNGMNITGVAWSDSEGIVVSGNTITNGYYGINLWSSSYGTHTTGYGLADVVVANNMIRLRQTSWTTDPGSGGAMVGNAFGIEFNPISNLPVKAVTIEGNAVEYDLEADPSLPYLNYEGAIGYYTSGGGTFSDVHIKNNTILNANIQAIYWNCPGSGLEISGNKIVNPASSLNPGLVSTFHNAIFLAGLLTNARVNNNNISDTNATSRMARGIYFALTNGSDVSAENNVFNIVDPAHASLVSFTYANTNTQVPLVSGMVIAPPITQPLLGNYGVATGSQFFDASTGSSWTWIAAQSYWLESP
jgi:parallel beta-helix repeat protein